MIDVYVIELNSRLLRNFSQVQHPTILEINRRILGDDCQLGSIASNTIFPGGSGQEPHIDYPYWDYYNK